MTTPNARFLQQLVELRNRVIELGAEGRLNRLTREEVALLSYAIGSFTGYVFMELETLKAPRAPRRATKKAKART
jgi:hypothetical protein